jgi:hypothetical protein
MPYRGDKAAKMKFFPMPLYPVFRNKPAFKHPCHCFDLLKRQAD